MAEEMRCGRATVQRSLDRLDAAGYVEKRLEGRPGQPANPEKQPFASYSYRVRLDVEPPLESVTEQEDGVPTGEHPLPTDGHPVPTHGRAPLVERPLGNGERDARARVEGLAPFMSAATWHPSSNLADTEAAARETIGLPPLSVLIAAAKAYHARNIEGRKNHPAIAVSAHTFIRKRMWREFPPDAGSTVRQAQAPAWPGYEAVWTKLRAPDPARFDALPGKLALIEDNETDVFFEGPKKIICAMTVSRSGWPQQIDRAFSELGKRVHLRAPVPPPAPWVGN